MNSINFHAAINRRPMMLTWFSLLILTLIMLFGYPQRERILYRIGSPNSERLKLETHQNLWFANRPEHYQFEITQVFPSSIPENQCFCGKRGESELIEVIGTHPINAGGDSEFSSIEGLLGFMGQSLNKDPYWFYADYDPEYGYPTCVYLKVDPLIYGCTDFKQFLITNFRVIDGGNSGQEREAKCQYNKGISNLIRKFLP